MRALITTLLTLAALPLQAEIVLKQDGNNMEVLVDGKLFTEYRSDTRVPCLYPLMSSSGAHLTRQHPFVEGVKGEAADHPHHTSFWFTHGSVNGRDFWHKPECKIVHVDFAKTKSDPSSGYASFSVDLDWQADGKSILKEKRTYKITAKDKTRTIDVDSRLTPASGNVVFGDTKEGSFAIRVAPSLRLKGEVAKGHILNSEGDKDGETWGKRAKWVAYYGPDGSGEPAVVAILDHSENLRHPTWWHARDYGLLGANPFGRHDFEKKKDQPHLGDYTLKKGDILHQQYRLILHEGTLESAKVEESWKEFAK